MRRLFFRLLFLFDSSFYLSSLSDEVVLQNVVDFKGKRVVSAESAHVDLSAFEDDPAFKKEQEKKGASSATKLSDEQQKGFFQWLKEDALAGKVSDITSSDRLVDSPVLIADYEGAQMRRMMKYVDPQGAKTMELPMQKLLVNDSHPLIVRLASIYSSPDGAAKAKLVAQQLLDNALITAGLVDDSRQMLPRIVSILEQFVGTPAKATADDAEIVNKKD